MIFTEGPEDTHRGFHMCRKTPLTGQGSRGIGCVDPTPDPGSAEFTVFTGDAMKEAAAFRDQQCCPFHGLGSGGERFPCGLQVHVMLERDLIAQLPESRGGYGALSDHTEFTEVTFHRWGNGDILPLGAQIREHEHGALSSQSEIITDHKAR